MTCACLLKLTLYLNREHVVIYLIVIQPRACSARYWLFSAQQSWPIRKQEQGLTFTGTLILCCTLLVKTCCQNNAIESYKSVISVIKIRGISTFYVNVHVCSGLMWDSVTMHRMKQTKQKSVKEIRKFHNLMQGAPWLNTLYDLTFRVCTLVSDV